ncbi:MAG: prefoldin subunit alpha [Candidatus Nanohaloarchaea archaeon]
MGRACAGQGPCGDHVAVRAFPGQRHHRVQEYQAVQQQMEGLEEYSDEVADEIEDMHSTKDAITEIAESEAGDEIFFPLGEGAFARGELVDTDEVLVDLGADTYAEKPVADAQDLIADRIDELAETQDRIQEQQEELQEKVQDLAPKLQEMQRQMQGQ